LVFIAHQGLSRGWLPFGRKGFFRRIEVRRSEHPFFYWLLFVLYGAGGVASMIFALMLLMGHAAPLPVL